MKNLNQKTLAVATAAVLGLGVAGTAHAGAKAFSSLIISNFTITDGASQLNISDFDIIEISDTADASASLNGVGVPTQSQDRFASKTTPLTPAVADPGAACVGANCAGIGQNNFNQQPQPPLQQFARADALLTGAVITGVGATIPTSATASQASEVQINTNGSVGSSDSSVTNSTRFNFSLTDSTPVGFVFNAASNFHLLMEQEDVSAVAGRAFSIVIETGGTEVFRWAPNGAPGGISGGTETADAYDLTFNRSLLTTGQIAPPPNSGAFAAVTNALDPNVTYSITINGTTNASARVSVPEPATLALLSVGLLGMGAASSRRRRKV